MNDPSDNTGTKGTEAPLLDRALLYGVCPGLFLLSLFLVGKSLMIGQQIVDSTHALFPSIWLLAVSGVLLVFCVGLTCWRISSFNIERRYSVRETGLTRRARHFEDMLHLVVDNIPNMLFISDRDGRVWFANREAVPRSKDVEEVVGKTLDRLFPPRHAEIFVERIRQAQKAGAPVITLDRRDDAAGPHYFETYHVPLPDTSDLHHTVLVTQKDITSTVIERERQEQTLKQIVDALIAVIDRRDPYAAGHSLRVGTVSAGLAEFLGLDDTSIEASRIAGSLMNLGKIMVSRRVLVKASALNQEELNLVRKAILASADILSLISFQMPVIPTLRQSLERYDGKGVPEGRKGENIMITARIVALVNAFIALVSPRAHRPGLSVDEALSILSKDSGTAYDPRLVKALSEQMRNDPSMREAVMKPPPEIKGIIPVDDLE